MELRPTITFEQYEAACQAVAAAKPKTLPTPSWLQILIWLVACLTIGLLPQLLPFRSAGLILVTVLLVLWTISKPLAKRRRKEFRMRLYAEEQAQLNDQILTIDASGISCNRGGGAVTSHHTWKAFISVIELTHAYLFLPSPNTFIRIPKELLTSTDDQQLREWSSAIPRAAAD